MRVKTQTRTRSTRPPLRLFEREVLGWLYKAYEDCAFAVACDGASRALAWDLEKKGYAEWKGEMWGSFFFQITGKGIKYYLRTEEPKLIKERSRRAVEHGYGLKSPKELRK